jgi:hypothetical protein
MCVIALPMITPVFAEINSVPDGSGTNSIPTGAGTQSRPANTDKVINPLSGKADNLTQLIFLLADIALQIGAVIAVLALIYSGFKFVTARGSEKGIGDAKTTFYYTIVGIAILFGAKIIAMIIEGTIESLKNI